MARSLPERTVDAYLAMTVAKRFPRAGLWDPTNTPGIWDHTLLAAGKTILFESKGNEAGNNDISVDVDQLIDYLTRPIAPLVFYLFADPPGWSDPRPPAAPGFPARTWPSFAKWGYVVPAATLALATGLAGKAKTIRPNNGLFEVASTGAAVRAVPLGRFFQELEDCFWVTARRDGDGAVVPGRLAPDASDMRIGDIESVSELQQQMRRREPAHPRLLTAVALHLPL